MTVDPLLAYLDPTSGSIAYQAAISGLLAAAAACRLYWHKLKRLFGARESHAHTTGESPDTAKM